MPEYVNALGNVPTVSAFFRKWRRKRLEKKECLTPKMKIGLTRRGLTPKNMAKALKHVRECGACRAEVKAIGRLKIVAPETPAWMRRWCDDLLETIKTG